MKKVILYYTCFMAKDNSCGEEHHGSTSGFRLL